jgi:hypothetical protein
VVPARFRWELSVIFDSLVPSGRSSALKNFGGWFLLDKQRQPYFFAG